MASARGVGVEEAHRMARMIEEEGIRSVVINMEHASFDRGLAQALANERDLFGEVDAVFHLAVALAARGDRLPGMVGPDRDPFTGNPRRLDEHVGDQLEARRQPPPMTRP